MRVLVACECSGIVRDAFRARGHDAWSCDLQPCEGDPRWHIQGDAIEAAYTGVTNSGSRPLSDPGYVTPWDLLIAHPECTFLANCSAKHLYVGMRKENGPNPERWARLGAGAQFFMTLWRAPIRRKCLENPIMLGHPRRLFGVPRPAQIIQPFQFGDPESKATGLYLNGLMPLRPRFADWEAYRLHAGLPADAKPEQRVWRMAPGENRRADRSRTFPGIARSMAEQWGAADEQRQAA